MHDQMSFFYISYASFIIYCSPQKDVYLNNEFLHLKN